MDLIEHHSPTTDCDFIVLQRPCANEEAQVVKDCSKILTEVVQSCWSIVDFFIFLS